MKFLVVILAWVAIAQAVTFATADKLQGGLPTCVERCTFETQVAKGCSPSLESLCECPPDKFMNVLPKEQNIFCCIYEQCDGSVVAEAQKHFLQKCGLSLEPPQGFDRDCFYDMASATIEATAVTTMPGYPTPSVTSAPDPYFASSWSRQPWDDDKSKKELAAAAASKLALDANLFAKLFAKRRFRAGTTIKHTVISNDNTDSTPGGESSTEKPSTETSGSLVLSSTRNRVTANHPVTPPAEPSPSVVTVTIQPTATSTIKTPASVATPASSRNSQDNENASLYTWQWALILVSTLMGVSLLILVATYYLGHHRAYRPARRHHLDAEESDFQPPTPTLGANAAAGGGGAGRPRRSRASRAFRWTTFWGPHRNHPDSLVIRDLPPLAIPPRSSSVQASYRLSSIQPAVPVSPEPQSRRASRSMLATLDTTGAGTGIRGGANSQPASSSKPNSPDTVVAQQSTKTNNTSASGQASFELKGGAEGEGQEQGSPRNDDNNKYESFPAAETWDFQMPPDTPADDIYNEQGFWIPPEERRRPNVAAPLPAARIGVAASSTTRKPVPATHNNQEQHHPASSAGSTSEDGGRPRSGIRAPVSSAASVAHSHYGMDDDHDHPMILKRPSTSQDNYYGSSATAAAAAKKLRLSLDGGGNDRTNRVTRLFHTGGVLGGGLGVPAGLAPVVDYNETKKEKEEEGDDGKDKDSKDEAEAEVSAAAKKDYDGEDEKIRQSSEYDIEEDESLPDIPSDCGTRASSDPIDDSF